MNRPNINTTKVVVPMIYAYTTPEVKRHDGWTKIGYTEQDVDTRIKQQTHTADVEYNLEWKGNAVFDDGSGEMFTDKDFHAYLRKSGIEQEEGKNNEWFHVTGPVSKGMFYDFRADRGILKSNQIVIPYKLREEQKDAVDMTVEYSKTHENGEFLWNAKPRFGKTLSVYDFCKQIDAQTVLIVTNRPAIANSWFSDYSRFLGTESGYVFVSEVDALKGKAGVLSRAEYTKLLTTNEYKCIEFVSLQDMKGSVYFGGEHNKLGEVANMNWDVLVIDEAHEGVDTYKTDVAFEHINRKFTLHLSGTPFKALANAKFPDKAIYNWTYADEQKKKHGWDSSSEEENPYATLPQLNLFTYQMSEIVRDELQQGIEIQGETEEYAFDLNEFFATTNGKFNHDSSVDKFLDALTLQTKFPFSTPELRAELNHTFWLLDRVESAKALTKKLREHPVFKDYEVVLAAGDGRTDDDEETMKSYDKVVKAIAEHEKTITLSVGQLTTGITIPEWTAVLMLSNVKSPALYMQAAFRAQNPCLFKKGTGFERKENAYVFDFDPARTLTIFEEFANDLSANTAAGRGDIETRKQNIRDLLNFFPVIGEDENGELIELDAEKVLTIPRKIRSVEVVRRGFMSNFLFQNINNVFSAPKEVIDIISSFEAVGESKPKVTLSEEVKKELSLDENGEVAIDDEVVVGIAAGLFGDKIYDVSTSVQDAIISVQEESTNHESRMNDRLKAFVKDTIVKDIVETTQTNYGSDMKASDKRQIESKLNAEADRMVDKAVANYTIEKNVIEQERTEALQARHETGKTTEEINREFDKKQEEANDKFKTDLSAVVDELLDKYGTENILSENVRANKILVFMLKRGFINENYADYINYFHPNSITEGEMNYIRGIRMEEPVGDFTYPIKNVERVCEKIEDYEFKQVEALNYDVADYLFTERLTDNKCKNFFVGLTRGTDKELEFINCYVERNKNCEIFIKTLCSYYPGFWCDISNNNVFTEDSKFKYLALILSYAEGTDIVKINNFSEYGNIKDFIEQNEYALGKISEVPANKLCNIIDLLDLYFVNINIDNVDSGVLEHIFSKKKYELNVEMICRFCEYKFPEKVQALKTANYTTLCEIAYGPVMEYVHDNFANYVTEFILEQENNTCEDVNAVEDILERLYVEAPDICKCVLDKQTVRWEIIEDCCRTGDVAEGLAERQVIWNHVLKNRMVKAVWANFISYYKCYGMTDGLLTWLDEEIDMLIQDNNIPSKIVEEIIISDISLDAFTKMIQTYKIEEFENGLKDFTPEQIGIMIRQKCIPFKPELLDEVQDKANEFATEYIQNNSIEFVDDLENCNLTVDVVTSLIRNNEFNDSQKLIILQKISEDEVNLLLAMAIRELEFTVPKEYVEVAWEILDEENRYQLLLNHLNVYTLDEISEKLSLLAPDYQKLADRSKRHKENLYIDEIGYNEALLKKLHEKEYLTSVEVEDYLTHNIKTHKKETHQRFVVWVKKANE